MARRGDEDALRVRVRETLRETFVGSGRRSLRLERESVLEIAGSKVRQTWLVKPVKGQ